MVKKEASMAEELATTEGVSAFLALRQAASPEMPRRLGTGFVKRPRFPISKKSSQRLRTISSRFRSLANCETDIFVCPIAGVCRNSQPATRKRAVWAEVAFAKAP